MAINRIRDELYHELSTVAYFEDPFKSYTFNFEDGKQTWKVTGVDKFLLHDDDTGFDAIIYKKNNDFVISFRGTEGNQILGDGWKDIVADVQYVVAKDKVNKFGLDINIVDEKINFDLHEKNQFRQAEKLVKAVQEKYPQSNISLTGHSLGGALASYAAAVCNVAAVTFNSPSVVGLLSEKKQSEVMEGKFDKQIVNYVHPKDSISAGAFEAYERHIGSTYYIGTQFQYENNDINPFYRFYKSISGENYHALEHYKFDRYGNINNPVITNVLTGANGWKSPRFFSPEVASIDVTPQHLDETAKRLDYFIGRVDDLCNDIKRTANLLENIKRSDYIIDEVIQSAQDFNIWYSHKTLEIKHNLSSSSLAFIEADKLHE